MANESEQEKRETLANIVAEYRRDYEDMKAKRLYLPTAEYLRRLLDRIEAAWKREREPVGNAAAMREALVAVQKKIEYLCGSFNVPNSLVAGRMEINGIINAALAAPPRQCDVGTPGEQSKRYDEFCDIHDCRSDCPLFKADSCELAWAQMPYEAEEGAGK